eukprot:gb/GEZN01001887.1/.p1 GENE.gb/GEZN01001887.1/~~gb/GEZN01001887.1/.p1  ORF type:complete len:598 (+),score=84.47 gb/GEZN01001887.1/:142-1935(+)
MERPTKDAPSAKRRKKDSATESEQDSSSPAVPDVEWDVLESFLQSINLQGYAPKLRDEGFDTIERVALAEMDDLQYSGGVAMKRGHARELIKKAHGYLANESNGSVNVADEPDWPFSKLQQPCTSGQLCVLLAGGAYSPPTNMHLRIFEEARDHLAQLNWEVVGGFISPVHDRYGKISLVEGCHRLNMCRLSAESSDWINVSPYEVRQDCWTPTLKVLSGCHSMLEASNLYSRPVAVKLLCGADLLLSFSSPGIWSSKDIAEIMRDFGVVVIPRHGVDLDEVIASSAVLCKYKSNIQIVSQRVVNSVSSSEIRKHLESNLSVKYLIPDDVTKYIYQHKLFGHSISRYKTQSLCHARRLEASASFSSSSDSTSPISLLTRDSESVGKAKASSTLSFPQPSDSVRKTLRPSGRAQTPPQRSPAERKLGLFAVNVNSPKRMGVELNLSGPPTSAEAASPDFSFLTVSGSSTPKMNFKELRTTGRMMDSPRLPNSILPASSHLNTEDFSFASFLSHKKPAAQDFSFLTTSSAESPMLGLRDLRKPPLKVEDTTVSSRAITSPPTQLSEETSRLLGTRSDSQPDGHLEDDGDTPPLVSRKLT